MREANQKRVHTVRFQLHDILKKAKLRIQWKDQCLLGVGEKGKLGRAQMNFRAVKILCVSLQWCIHVIIHLSNLTEYLSPRVTRDINYGLWMIVIYQCQFSCNKCTTLMSNADGRVCSCVGWGICRKFLYLSLNFAMNYSKKRKVLKKSPDL